MNSLGVLSGIRKGKSWPDGRFRHNGRRLALGCALLSALFCCAVPGAAAAEGKDATLSTRQGESVIAKDPATGDRVMRTPDPKPQEEYQGPQTILVAPEVYPGGSYGSRGSRAERPQSRE